VATEIIWTLGAEQDLLLLYRQMEALSGDDDDLPLRLLRRPLMQGLKLLSENPSLGRRLAQRSNVRRLLIGPDFRHGLFYVVETRGIIVHALLDLRQDPALILRRLKGI
jgi:plasmid stabilization system protein ParE